MLNPFALTVKGIVYGWAVMKNPQSYTDLK